MTRCRDSLPPAVPLEHRPAGIKGRTQSDCGVVAIANATNRSYSEVKARFGRFDRRGGMERHELEWLIGEFAHYSAMQVRKQWKLKEWAAARFRESGRHVNWIVVVARFTDFHVTAVVNGQVIDQSDRSDWIVCVAYRIAQVLP